METERPKFLVDLLTEVDGCDASLFPPTNPAKPDEKVVGELSSWTRKLFALGRYYDKQARLLTVEYDCDSVEKMQEHPEIAESALKHRALQELLWFLICAELALWNGNGVGVRTGWTVVEPKTDDEPASLKALRKLFGG